MTDEESKKIWVVKRKEWEEDGMEDGKRRQSTGKEKEREKTEETDREWRKKVEDDAASLKPGLSLESDMMMDRTLCMSRNLSANSAKISWNFTHDSSSSIGSNCRNNIMEFFPCSSQGNKPHSNNRTRN